MDNKTLIVYAWDMSLEFLERIILSGKYSHIDFYFYQEYEIPLSKEVVDFINRNRITLTAVSCLMFKSDLRKLFLPQGISPFLIKDLDVWSSAYLNISHMNLLENELYSNNAHENKNFKYPFLTFNGANKIHRTKLIDNLAKYNLIDQGIVTYHNVPNLNEYAWKYHNGSVLTIDDEFKNHYNSYMFNNIFLESFLHIPTESMIDYPLMSEKTAIPLLNKLPFLVLGSQNLHRKMSLKFGFKLYNEIFDYSFDRKNRLDDRIKGIIKNIQYVISQKNNLNELYKTIQDKVDFNKNLALEIIHDYNSMPKVLQKRIHSLITHNQKLITNDYNLITIAQTFKGLVLPDLEIFEREKRIIGEYSVWDNPIEFSYEQIVNDIQTYDYDFIKILSEHEWEIWFSEEFIFEIKRRNIHVDITVLGDQGKWYNDYIKKHKLKKYVTVYHWPTYFFNYTNLNLEKGNHKKTLKMDNVIYPFLCLNRRGHQHRAKMIDKLAEKNLLNKGKFSWHDPKNENCYNFRFFNGSKHFLDKKFTVHSDQYIVPNEFETCLFHLITESTVDLILLSEKTSIPIYYKKPFLILGGTGIHQKLKSLGFELFEEYIDYSFDEEDNCNKRIEMISKEIEKISNIQDLNDAYRKLLPKVEHNQQTFKKIISDKSLIPRPNKEVFDTLSALDKYQDYRKTYLTIKRLNYS